MARSWLLYGAYGYTGELTARRAVEVGEEPILAGRDGDKLQALAEQLGLPHRTFSLDDSAALRAGLEGVDLVLHDAGPFSATSAPMVSACLEAGVHYLDITGEIGVFEQVHAQDDAARTRGVVLMPGVGFDVVPTDCMAAMLHERLPDATSLELAFAGLGEASRGTMKTMFEGMPHGGWVREDGRLRQVPLGWKSKSVEFPHGEMNVVSIPWGDLSTAFRTTGIPNITTYMAMPPKLVRGMKRLEPMRGVMGATLIQKAGKKLIEWTQTGPDAALRERGWSDVWGKVTRDDGTSISGSYTTLEGYTFTVEASLRAVRRVLDGDLGGGAWTPARAFGSDFVLEVEGTTEPTFERHDASQE